MELSLSKADLKSYVTAQLQHFFPDKHQADFNVENQSVFELALERTEFCFSSILLAPYKKHGTPLLNHLYSDQYAVFLWFLSNSVWKETEDKELANKLFYLNKALHGFSCTYDTALPNVFALVHTVGTVLGKATYSDYLVAYQGSTVGAQDGKYPVIGKGVSLLPYSSVVGDCQIGSGVSVGLHATVYKRNIPNDTVVFRGENGAIQQRFNSDSLAKKIFSID